MNGYSIEKVVQFAGLVGVASITIAALGGASLQEGVVIPLLTLFAGWVGVPMIGNLDRKRRDRDRDDKPSNGERRV